MVGIEACKLDYWVGRELFAYIPLLSHEPIFVKVRNVEAGGVWIECEQITLSFICGTSEPPEIEGSPELVAFLPYSQINFLMIVGMNGKQAAPVLTFTKRSTASDNGAGEKEK